MKRLQETVDWIYGEGQQAAANAFRTKFEEFKKANTQIKERFLFHTELPIFLEQFQNFAAEMNGKIDGATNLTDQIR